MEDILTQLLEQRKILTDRLEYMIDNDRSNEADRTREDIAQFDKHYSDVFKSLYNSLSKLNAEEVEHIKSHLQHSFRGFVYQIGGQKDLDLEDSIKAKLGIK